MHPEARALIDALGLTPHPEGGYYRENFRSPDRVATPRGPRAASTAIYFLLPAGCFSGFHRVLADETWHHYAGDALELVCFDAAGIRSAAVLGPDIAAGQEPQRTIRAGLWQAARTLGERFTLCGCTVAPGFEFEDFELGERAALLARFPALASDLLALTR